MKCRKCGTEIPDNSIRCSNCGTRVNMRCPKCKTINPFGSNVCSCCGFELLKKCPECEATNIYSATKCRKCNFSFNTISLDNIIEVDNEDIKTQKQNEQEIVSSFSSFKSANMPISDINIPQTTIIPNEIEPNLNFVTESNVKYFNVDDPIFEETIEEKDVSLEDNLKSKVPVTQQESFSEFDSNIEIEPIVDIEDNDVSESLKEETVEEENAEKASDSESYNPVEVQPEITKKIKSIIKKSIKKHIIAIQGPEGCGKTAVLKQINESLSKRGYLFLYGSCTPLVQITSFGFFQDAFLRMMGFPPFTKSTESFIKDFKKSNLAGFFKFLSGNELNAFLNIFYPSQKDSFENILSNKKVMFSILEKVIKSLSLNNNLVITIDNFELLDGASYEFIVHMMKQGYFNNRLKLLVAYQEDKSIQSYFDVSKNEEQIFSMFKINKLESVEMIESVKQSLYIDIQEILSPELLEEILQKSNGNALRIEQEVALLFNTGYISLSGNDILINEDNRPEIEPISFEELLKLRLNALTPVAKNVLFMAAIMGYRFANSILCLAVTLPSAKAEKLLDYLIQEQYIQKVDNYTCEFKSLTLWKLIYKEAQADLLYKENSERLYLSLKPLILSSNLQKLISCTDALSKNEAFLIWQNTSSIAAKLGDTNLYVIAQKQCLKLLEEQNLINSEDLKAEIYEQIGKLLSEKSPKEAVTYLANVLDSEIKESNLSKIIDLSSYFIRSCYLSGNYFGAAEAVDTVLSNIEVTQTPVEEIDIELIQSRKLKALFHIGNSEQIINLVNEDIIPKLEKGLSNDKYDDSYKSLIIDAWLASKTFLAKAYAIQGNNQVFNVITELKNFLDKYSYETKYYSLQISIIEAFAQTIIGNVNKSNEILSSVYPNFTNEMDEPYLFSEWNLISVINRILLDDKVDLKADLFELAAYTNNINEHFVKNIIKLILGNILNQEGNKQKALEIYNDEITYFAKEKVAIGAMLAWAFIVKITMEMGDDEKALNTAIKSLEIAQSPKINNYFFTIYFQKYIAEIYQRKSDFTAAKMYLEKAIMIAKQFDLKYQIIELYVAYGEYMQEFMKVTHNYASNHVALTQDMYSKALSLSKELNIPNLVEKVKKARQEFRTFCQLNSIG